MHLKTMLLGCAIGCAAATPARADTVCEWVDFSQMMQSVAAPMAAPGTDRIQTQVALAMFEALNSIDRRYESYLSMPVGDRSASPDAAAATAAYRVLSTHFPGQKAALDENYLIAMEAVADGRARESGKAVGEAAAALALKSGQVDAAAVPSLYRPRTSTGVWVPTQLPVFDPAFTTFKPWILPRVDAVRPGPPPALTSETWTRDYDEVKRLGGKKSKERTAHQTLMARYRITPNMMPTMRIAADSPGRRPVENARMFAMMAMILDDALMATAEAKLHYNFWRPVTAIRNGEDDGNPATAPDAGWEPLIATPNHPEYPCGHCMIAGSIGEFMTAEVGAKPHLGVRVSSRSIANSAVQALPSWDEWVRQVNASRTYGGVHYRFSNEAGEQIGRKVARMALANVMRPLPKSAKRASP
jgi:hypothetical protein